MTKRILMIAAICLTTITASFAQGNGNGNSNHNHQSNNWGQNGNGNAYGQGNGNGNGNGNSGGSGSEGIDAPSEDNQSASASQSTHLALSNAIEITFTGNNSEEGADVTIPFTSVNDYANGVESGAQELKVRSNKNFSVAVKTNNANFSYAGNTTPAPVMPVSGVLGVKVTANSTGGSIASPFSAANYATLTSANQNLISAGSRGGNQTFSVKYKATPGFAYPAGTYSVDVVYTATQQ